MPDLGDFPYFYSPAGLAGAQAESIPRAALSSATFAPTSGTLYLFAIFLQGDKVISELGFLTVAAASAPTHQWVCLVDATEQVGTIRAISADNTGAYGGTNTLALTSFVTPFQVPGDGGLYYAGYMSAATTTTATLASNAGVANLNGINPVIAASALTGQTTPPAVGTSVGALTAIANVAYAVAF
jgi:hypothetical protein